MSEVLGCILCATGHFLLFAHDRFLVSVRLKLPATPTRPTGLVLIDTGGELSRRGCRDPSCHVDIARALDHTFGVSRTLGRRAVYLTEKLIAPGRHAVRLGAGGAKQTASRT